MALVQLSLTHGLLPVKVPSKQTLNCMQGIWDEVFAAHTAFSGSINSVCKSIEPDIDTTGRDLKYHGFYHCSALVQGGTNKHSLVPGSYNNLRPKGRIHIPNCSASIQQQAIAYYEVVIKLQVMTLAREDNSSGVSQLPQHNSV